MKRLDLNGDGKIDFCEFHAFLGYPDCSFCCPCFPCPNCGIKYCEECLNDIPCYLLGCNHKSMNSKMRCTSIEHNPNIGQINSLMNSKNMNPYNSNKSFYKTKIKEEENEKNQNNYNKIKSLSNGKYPNNLSPEQYNLLQGLTNPEQVYVLLEISIPKIGDVKIVLVIFILILMYHVIVAHVIYALINPMMILILIKRE